jgi:hypothetical protein
VGFHIGTCDTWHTCLQILAEGLWGLSPLQLMVGGERTTCASTASSLSLRRANARRPLTRFSSIAGFTSAYPAAHNNPNGGLFERLWGTRHLSVTTNMKCWRADVLLILLAGSEMWSPSQAQLLVLEWVHTAASEASWVSSCLIVTAMHMSGRYYSGHHHLTH